MMSVFANRVASIELLNVFTLALLNSGCGYSLLTSNLTNATNTGILGTHNGWTQARALGGRTVASQSIDLVTSSAYISNGWNTASVTLSWNAMSLPSGSITSYNIYRSTIAGAENFAAPLATGISSTSLTYTDTSVSPLTTYFYVVRPVANGLAFATSSTDTEIKIPVPPVNMSLIHRWVANWEMCGNLMGRTIDRGNNYRCAYAGPLSTGGYYDVGQNQFWDAVDLGCNYTPPNPTSALSCGDPINGCLNIGNPNNSSGSGGPSAGPLTGGLNAAGKPQVYYDRGSNQCYVWTTGTTWVRANLANNTQLASMASNQAGLPPLAVINQQQSWNACQQFSVSGLGAKRLPKHSEQVVASAWPPSYSDSLIATIENGINLPATGYCNSNNASGVSFDNNPTPANIESLPGATSSNDYAVRTGSTSTQNCVSYYGLQDIVGNVYNWSTDQLSCTAGAPYTCNGVASGVVGAVNNDWSDVSLPINFDGAIAPGGGGSQIPYWNLENPSYGATQFLIPLGLPLVGSVSSLYDSLAIGPGSGQFNSSKLHDNVFYLYTGNTVTSRGAFAGGMWITSSWTGRFTLILNTDPTANNSFNGLRCMLSAGN